MKKSVGSYVKDGTKKSLHYLSHHFGSYFIFWILGIVSSLSQCTIFLAPVFQKQQYALCHMVKDADEIIFSKSFDGTDRKSSYRSLLLFDLLWLLITLVIVGVIIGLAFFVMACILNIYHYSFREEYVDVTAYNNLVDSTMYVMIPFIVIAAVALLFSLLVLQVGTHIAGRNSSLSVGDIALNSFQVLKKSGWKIFGLDFLYFLEILTYGGIVFCVLYLIPYFVGKADPSDVNLPLWILWMLIPVIVVLSIFVVPALFLSTMMGSHLLLEDVCTSDRLVVSYKGQSEEDKLSYIPLSPVDDIGSVRDVPLEKNKTPKDTAEKDED